MFVRGIKGKHGWYARRLMMMQMGKVKNASLYSKWWDGPKITFMTREELDNNFK